MLLDREGNLRRIKGDIGFLRELYAAYLSEIPLKLKELTDALARLDYGHISYVSHSFAGASASIGAESCKECAEKIERLSFTENAGEIKAAIEELEEILDTLKPVLEKECGITSG